MKGVIETEAMDKYDQKFTALIATGRLSTMAGEISDEDFTISLPLLLDDSCNAAETRRLLDMPTRLFRDSSLIHDKTLWRGRVPAGTVLGRYYPSESASFTVLPEKQQILLEGHICSSLYVDGEGNCTFDRSSEALEALSAAEAPVESVNSHVTSHGVEDKVEEAEEEPCPLCRFVKRGPCKDSFMTWNKCMSTLKEDDELSKCFSQTANMMRCMRKYEYYDIMVFGMDFSKLDAIDHTRKLEEVDSSNEASSKT